MKYLKDFESDLNKCSKCGLCESVCPLFKLNPNDCVASKGKFIMLHGVTKGDLTLSKNINKYIDMCLKCGKCKIFCPSGIDICQILATAKYEYMKNTLWGKFINFLESKYVFGLFLQLGALVSAPYRPEKSHKKPVQKVVYFKGCVNKICPQTDNYLNKIFKNVPFEIIEPDFDCCGIPFLSEGNMERFIQAAEHNLKLLDIDYDYLVTDCASCESTLHDYPKILDCGENVLNVVNWGELIADKGLKFRFKKPVMENYDDCCGFSGSFALKNRKLSMELSKQKAKNIVQTGADYVITTCPACVLGLKQGLFLTGGKTKIVSLLEFLAKAESYS